MTLPFLHLTLPAILSPSLHVNDVVAKAHKRFTAIYRAFISHNAKHAHTSLSPSLLDR